MCCSPQALAAALEKNSTITTINLSGNSIGHEGAKAGCFQSANTCALACAVFPLRHWQQHLRRTELSPPSTLREIPAVTRVPRPGASRLQALVHWHVMFSPQALATALEKNSTITIMDLAGNSIGHEGAKARCFQAPGTCALACDVFPPGTGSST